jgi:DNA-binding GntR family transcriptional regulator
MLDLIPADVLDRSNPEPIYLQIKSWLMSEIESGRWPVHYKLPAEEDLAKAIHVNRGTLHRAVRELIATGHLTQIHGRGTFVASPKLEQPLAHNLVTFSEDLIGKGVPFETEVLEQSVVKPTQRVASLLSLNPEAPILFLQRRRWVDGRPLILLHNHVVLDYCPKIERVDFTKHRLFEALEEIACVELDWGRRTFAALVADEERARLMNVAPGDPLMYMEQVVYLNDGSPIELSDVWLQGDHFRLSAMVRRQRSAPLRTPTPGNSSFPGLDGLYDLQITP